MIHTRSSITAQWPRSIEAASAKNKFGWNLLNTDVFLSAHVNAVLYEFEPASPDKALEACLKSLYACQVYLLIVASQYGTLVGKQSITHAEYRHAKSKNLPVLAFIKGDRSVKREAGTEDLLRELDADGPKYKRFGNVIELQKEVRSALVKLLTPPNHDVESSDNRQMKASNRQIAPVHFDRSNRQIIVRTRAAIVNQS